MDFAASARAAELTTMVADFLASEIEPVEPSYHAEVARLRETGDAWKPLPLLDELRAKARAKGLWNLFLPAEHAGLYAEEVYGGAGLSNVDYAPLAELMGRSAIA